MDDLPVRSPEAAVHALALAMAAMPDGLSAREKVTAIEPAIQKLPQIELTTKHYFTAGVYMRELIIPAGVILTGKIYKYAHFFLLMKGEISILIGQEIKRISAPSVISSQPGTKRIGLTHSDVSCMVVFPTSETDPDVIMQKFTAADEAEYAAFCAEPKLLECA